jgi:hypothetical protein
MAASAVLAALLASACGPGDGAPATGPVDRGNATLTVTSEIPREIHAAGLEVLGTARTGDTVRATVLGIFASAVAADGRFRLYLPIPRCDSAEVRLHARGVDGSRSDTLSYPIVAPDLAVYGIPDHPLGADSLRLQVQVYGFDAIRITLNGETTHLAPKSNVSDQVLRLKLNAKNTLTVRGVRNGVEAGDSLSYTVDQDAMPPKLLSQTLNYRNRPGMPDTTVTLVFDDSVWNLTAKLTHAGYSTDVTIAHDPDFRRFYFKFPLLAGDSATLSIRGSDRAGNPVDTPLAVAAYSRHAVASGNIMAAEPSFREGLLYLRESGGGRLQVLDTRTMKVADSIDIPPGDTKLTVNPFNRLLYVAVPASQSLMVIDPAAKTTIRSLPLPEKFFQSYEIRLVFRADGMGFLSIGDEETIYLIDAARQDTLYKAELFTGSVGIISTGFHAFDSSRAILISRGWGTLDYFATRSGDTAATPVPVPSTDRNVQVWGVNPYRDMIGLSDQRLIDAKGRNLGVHLFNREELQFGIDSQGRDFLIRRHGETTQVDRFRTTGLSELRIRGGIFYPLPGTDRLLLLSGKDVWEIDLNLFGP